MTSLETITMSGRMPKARMDKAMPGKKAKSNATGTRGARAGKPRKGESPTRATPTTKSKPGDWREETLARVRALILEAAPEVIEERKWRKPSNAMAGIPVWSHHREGGRDGIICTGETYKHVVKLTFAKGALLADPSGLFNSSLEGNTRRAIDLHEGDTIDEKAFKALVRAAVALNASGRGNEPPGSIHGS